MIELTEENNADWKRALHSELITSLIGTPQEKTKACSEIGYYYMCCAPAFLYKYYGDSLDRFETVKSNKMWYSAPCNFNDVFDCDISIDEKMLFESVLQMIPNKRAIRTGSPMWLELKQEVKQQIKVLQSDFETFKNSTGIACLGELCDSLLMWAHYANNHKGICVEYNLLEINSQLQFTPVPVMYSDKRACFDSINPETVNRDSIGAFIESVTTKSLDWDYEREWRIIREEEACGANWDTDKRGALLDMISPSAIILGCMATSEFETAVREYCQESSINLYKMKKSTDRYKLEKEPILQFN